MAMFAPIPLPNSNNDVFKDVMDYFEQLQQRKAQQQQAAAAQNLEEQKLAETSKYHQAQLAQSGDVKKLNMELLKAKIAALQNPQKKLSPPEQSQAMKLLESGRSLKSTVEKASDISDLLEENPDLTGWVPGAKSALNIPGEKLSEFSQKAAMLQAAMGRLASQRGGAQALKWAEKAKPSNWKDVASNKGMVNSILEDSQDDYDELKSEYENLTGEAYPIELPTMGKDITIIDSNGKEHTILRKNLGEAKKRDPGLKVKR